ncbi:putative metal-binding protein [Hydrogenophaga palleronii]|uniref:Metal-binding protein n=1 Tax=Hydrogenophaga palleronii TaxID=65655 RepID=A0ABU1WHZ8_9BURK|nr:DUF1636 domain-containing protein [Hydrogenophaga palleronii]MDR7148674.1 putative metal-binding protein [Hydrogenophaga palleronii]
MSAPVLPPTTEVIICTTCRPPGASLDLPAAGAELFEAVQTQLLLHDERWAHVRVRGMACLSSCSRSCSVAFQAPGKHTYLFGDLVPDLETALHVLDCATMHAAANDGNLVRNERPARLRSGILARLPPSLASTRNEGTAPETGKIQTITGAQK